MNTIPAFFVRKPWYTLLKYILQSGKFDDLNVKHCIIIKPINPDVFFSVAEKEYNNSDKLSLSYDFGYFLEDNIEEICWQFEKTCTEAIKTKFGKNNKSAFENIFHGAIGYNKTYTTGLKSYFQTQVNARMNDQLKTDINVNLALAVCDLALFIARDKKHKYLQDEIEILDKVREIVAIEYKKYDDSKPRKGRKPKSNVKNSENTINEQMTSRMPSDNIKETFKSESTEIDENLEDYWKSPILSDFYGTQWISFEHTDPINPKIDSWGIALNLVEIFYPDPNKLTHITLRSKHKDKEYTHKGICTIDINGEAEYIVAQLRRRVAGKLNSTSFYVMRISKTHSQSLLVGYRLYFSIKYKKFLAKVVVWKVNNERLGLDELNDIDKNFKPELGNSDEKFGDINLDIRRFLSDPLQVRMGIPTSVLSNLDDATESLKGWMDDKIKPIINDKILMACVDQYYVCYFYEDLEKLKPRARRANQPHYNISDKAIANHIRVDELGIQFIEDKVEFVSSYIHYRGEGAQRKPDSKFSGIVRHSQSTIKVLLDEEQNTTKRERDLYNNFARNFKVDNNFIILTFSVPGFRKFNEIDFFPGVITGLNDDDNTPVSFRCAVVKRRINSGEDILLNFNSNVQQDLRNTEPIQLSPNKSARGLNPLSKKIIRYFKSNLNQTKITIVDPFISSTGNISQNGRKQRKKKDK